MATPESSPLARALRAHLDEGAVNRLAGARVGIAGAGGLGSNVAMLLARSGIRNFVVADKDKVELSNLNRQFFWPEDIGKPKVQALRGRLLGLDPDIAFEARECRLEAATAAQVFAGCRIVVEALDDAALKAELCSALLAQGFYVVAASGLGGFGLPPMQVKRLGSFVCVGDFSSAVSPHAPALAPRVMQAAALQADAVLAKLLDETWGGAPNPARGVNPLDPS